MTIILVLHEINYAAFYSDSICAFVDGKIAKFGTVNEVMNKENLKDIYNVDFEIIHIHENAHVALDQVEYQKRYDGLTARFDTAKARYEALDETIHSKQSRRAKIEAFLEALAKAELVDTFDTALWCGLVDFVTVHGKDDVRFTFKNGQEIRA